MVVRAARGLEIKGQEEQGKYVHPEPGASYVVGSTGPLRARKTRLGAKVAKGPEDEHEAAACRRSQLSTV